MKTKTNTKDSSSYTSREKKSITVKLICSANIIWNNVQNMNFKPSLVCRYQHCRLIPSYHAHRLHTYTMYQHYCDNTRLLYVEQFIQHCILWLFCRVQNVFHLEIIWGRFNKWNYILIILNFKTLSHIQINTGLKKLLSFFPLSIELNFMALKQMIIKCIYMLQTYI